MNINFVMRNCFCLMLILGALALNSCENTDKSIVEKPSCDTSKVSYVTCVKPILDKQCVGCHSTGNTSGYVNLDNYADVKLFGVSGELYGCSAHVDGFLYMPPNGAPRMDTMSLIVIKKWTEQGFQP